MMSSTADGTRDVPAPVEAPCSAGERTTTAKTLSRRQAIPLMGLAALAVGACELDLDPVATQPEKAPEDWLAKARVHRGGLQRYAVHERADGVAVRIEDVQGAGGGELRVTVYETDPRTGGLIDGPDGPVVLERYEGVTNATLSRIESDYVAFYYVE